MSTKVKYLLTEKEKYANNKKLAKELMDELIPNFSRDWIEERDDMLSNYRLYNNDISHEDFSKVCNPLGLDIPDTTDEILPYNKTYQKIDVLLGEEYKRGLNYTLTLLNPKAIEDKDEELKRLYREYIQEIVERQINVAQLQQQGASPEEIEEVYQEQIASKTPEELEDITFLSELEILGNNILQYGIYEQEVRDKKNDGFKHALLSDHEYVYVGVSKGEPYIQILNSLQVFKEKDPEEKYTQKGDWAGHRTISSIQRILETYGDEMDDEDRKKLEDRVPGVRTPEISGAIEVNRESTLTNRYLSKMVNGEYLNDNIGTYSDDNYLENDSTLTSYEVVTNIEWKWLREVLFYTTISERGEEITTIVDSEFEIPKEAVEVEFVNKFKENSKKKVWIDENGITHSVEKLRIPRVWEGTRIGTDIYVRVREKPYQILDIENPYECTLGYHGLTYNSMNAKSISLMGRMKPFQFLFFIVLHQIKELIPKHIGPIQNFDTSMIDPNLAGINGGEEEDMFGEALTKTLYYRQSGLNIYNSMINNIGGEARETNISRPQPGSVENMSVAQDLNNLLELLGWIDTQIGMAAGVSPQREAQFTSNTNVTDNQQAIVQSSYITEHYFRKHNSLWKEVMQSYINYTKLAWKGDSVRKEFILQNGSLQTLKLEGSELDNADYGLFITDSGRNEEYGKKMEELALTFMQNGGSMESVSYILKARASGSSPEEVHKEIIKLQRRTEAQQQQSQEAELKNAEKIQQMQIDNREDEQEHEIMLERMKIEGQIAVAEIRSVGFGENQDINNDGIPDPLQVDEFQNKVRQKDEEIDLKRQELEFKKSKQIQDARLKEKQINKQSQSKSK